MPDFPGITNYPLAFDTPISLMEARDNASSTITAGVGAADLSFPVANPSEFSDTGMFTMVDDLDNPTKIEKIVYTSKVGSNLIIPVGGRGQDGTSAQSWSNGDFIEMRVTRKHFEVLQNAMIAVQTKLGIGATIPLTALAPLTPLTLAVADGAGVLASLAPGAGGTFLRADLTWQTVSASPGGSSGQVQMNNAGAFGGVSGVTSDGANMTFATEALRATNPRITTGIRDINGSPLISITPTASATQGLNITNNIAATVVTVETTAPTQIVTALAGTPFMISASNAIAGSGTAGAAAGGLITIRSGNAARLTSGDANGGNIALTCGSGIGLGTQGIVAISANSVFGPTGTGAATPSYVCGQGGLGIYRVAADQLGFAAGSLLAAMMTSSTFRVPSTGRIGFANGVASASLDTSFSRLAASVMRLDNGGAAPSSFVIAPDTASIGAGGVAVLAIGGSSAPTSSPADLNQLYVIDAAANDAQTYIRTESGRVNRLTGLSVRVGTQFDKTSNTTLSDVTDLLINVEALRTYRFVAELFVTANASGGVKASISGSMTVTSITYDAELKNGAALVAPGVTRGTALDAAVGDVTAAVTRILITGSLVSNAAGTITVKFAQNASFATPSSVLVNSTLTLIPVT